MDILIKGLEMPKEKDDVVILTIQPDGTTNIFGRRLLSLLRPSTEIHGLRKGITTAIKVPPHGDLVDRDYIKANGLSLNDAPVILEAST